jgi:uncharacterized DUF497 family protein
MSPYRDADFEWDEAKSKSNLAKHKVSFEVARLAFNDPNVVSFDGYYDQGELRYDLIGKVPESAYLRVTYTVRGAGESERIRIISARKADRKEKGIYDENVYK